MIVLGMRDKEPVVSSLLPINSNADLCPLKPGLLSFIIIGLSSQLVVHMSILLLCI